jgi:hypothetical protein
MADATTHTKTPGTANLSDLNNQTQLDFIDHCEQTLNQPVEYCKSYGEMRNWSVYLTTKDYSLFIRYKNTNHIDSTTDSNQIANWEKLGTYSIVTTDTVDDTIQQEILAFWPGINLAWFEIMTWVTLNRSTN